jgi:2-amino-4-hydroxy-6-hydroxymethyldihydropteridine diphosphokinase
MSGGIPSAPVADKPEMGVPRGPFRCWVGLGANLGDARRAFDQAREVLRAHPAISMLRCSSLWRSAPVDAGGPDYLNAVIELQTEWAPLALLALLQSLENEAGRTRPYRHAPRTLDLDLLTHGEQVQTDPILTLPHPRMHVRAFVLEPLLELAPNARIPGMGAARDWLGRIQDQPLSRLSAWV